MFCLSDFFGGGDSKERRVGVLISLLNSPLQEIDLFSRPALLLLNTRYSEIHIFQSPYCFFSEDEVMFVFCLPGRYGEILPYFHEFTVFIITY